MRKPMPLKQALLWMARKWDKPWQVGRRAYVEIQDLPYLVESICEQAGAMYFFGIIDRNTADEIRERASLPSRLFRFPRTLAGARKRAAWLRKWAAKL